MFIRAVAWATGFLVAFLVLDFLRRRGLPRLPQVQVPRLSLKSGPSVPDEFYLRLAKTVIEEKFERSSFGKKPFVDLFPKKLACPHCGGKQRNPWNLNRAGKLLSDVVKLAREIRQGRYCLGCLEQLSAIAAVEGKYLSELGKKDPKTLSTRPRGWGRTFLLLVAVSIIFVLLTSFLSLAPFLLKLMVNLPTLFFR